MTLLPFFCDWRMPPPARAVCCAALACIWTAFPLRAELTWTQKTVELSTDGKTSVLEARFPFTNGGATSVDIRQVQTSCGCTTVALAQRHFEPGQAGEIVAHYAIGNQVGLQKKMILVSITGSPGFTALTLVVHIPELVRVRPNFVTWNHDEPNAEKIITIESADPEALPLTNLTVLSSNNAFTADLEPLLEGNRYEISVTPKTTAKQLFATLTIRCHVGAEEKTFLAYASVQLPAPALRPRVPNASPAPASTPEP